MLELPEYRIELANRMRGSHAIGNLYVVTRGNSGRTCILASFLTREEAALYIRTTTEEGQ